MKNPSFDPASLRIYRYQAPPVSAVRPFVIPRGREVIELVTGGVVYFRSGDTDLKLGCGALFWHVAGDETIHRTEPDAPYRCIALHLHISSRAPRRMPRLTVIPDRQRVLELSQELLTTYHDESIDRRVLGDYVRSRLHWEVHLATSQRPGMDTPPAIRQAVAAVEEQFHNPRLSVGQLADTVGLSEPHLHSLFRKHLGQPPHQYVITRRIREAKIKLMDDSLTIKSIASDCGFENIETFYRAFKRTVSVTPYAYRRSHARPMMQDS